LRTVPVDVAAIARRTTADLVPEASRRRIDLGYEGPTRALATAEPVLVQEMLENLIDNALRHAGDAALVTVRVTPGAEDCAIEVEDNGPGLTPDQAEAMRAGRRDRRLVPTSRQTGSGYGFGLAIVREIAALLGARLDLDRPSGGRGLIVRVRLPPGPAE
jgi:two-component system sensor histidine kinase TctE